MLRRYVLSPEISLILTNQLSGQCGSSGNLHVHVLLESAYFHQ